MGVEGILTQKYKREKDPETPDEGRGFFCLVAHAGHCSPNEYQISLTTEYRMKNRPPAGCVNIDTFGGEDCAYGVVAASLPSKQWVRVRITVGAPNAVLAELVQHSLRKREYAGSTPADGSKNLYGRLAQLARVQARQA